MSAPQLSRYPVGGTTHSVLEDPICPCCGERLLYELDLDDWDDTDTCNGCGARFRIRYFLTWEFELELREYGPEYQEPPLTRAEMEARGQLVLQL